MHHSIFDQGFRGLQQAWKRRKIFLRILFGFAPGSLTHCLRYRVLTVIYSQMGHDMKIEFCRVAPWKFLQSNVRTSASNQPTFLICARSHLNKWKVHLSPETTLKKWGEMVTGKSARDHCVQRQWWKKWWDLWPSWKERFYWIMRSLMTVQAEFLWMIIAASNCCKSLATFRSSATRKIFRGRRT